MHAENIPVEIKQEAASVFREWVLPYFSKTMDGLLDELQTQRGIARLRIVSLYLTHGTNGCLGFLIVFVDV